MPFLMKINLYSRPQIIENPIKNVLKTRLKTYIDFLLIFHRQGGRVDLVLHVKRKERARNRATRMVYPMILARTMAY